MSMYAWLGVLVSSLGTTLALASWFVMAVPYFDNAPYLTELRKNSKLAFLLGCVLFVLFFSIFYLSAHFLDQDTSGPLLAFTGVIILLPASMLIGTETWDHYDAKGLNSTPGAKAVAVATGIGFAEFGVGVLIFMLLFKI